jgi:hypothetical protein
MHAMASVSVKALSLLSSSGHAWTMEPCRSELMMKSERYPINTVGCLSNMHAMINWEMGMGRQLS